jgi:hypothetical protein
MRALLTTTIEVLGIAAIAAGFTLIALPAGLIAAGLGMVIIGWRLA